MENEFAEKFKLSELTVKEYEHWVLSVRPTQITLGSLVLSLKRSCVALGEISADEAAELAECSAEIETMLRDLFCYDKINYLALMMVDTQVHFHIFPRYATAREFESITLEDLYWPGPITDFSAGKTGDELINSLCRKIKLKLSKGE